MGLIYVLSGEVGEVGGAAKAALLLCEALTELGNQVRLYVTSRPDATTIERLASRGVSVTVPLVRIGHRWSLPQRAIATQAYFAARRAQPTLIHCVSLSAEARYLLSFPSVAPVYLWESTDALPGGKFLDRKIHRYLHKANAVLAPSKLVAENVRTTYGYQGNLKLLPFWVNSPKLNSSSSGHCRQKNFLFVGRIDIEKGFEYLIEAFQQVHSKHPSATLTICGGGDVERVRLMAQSNAAINLSGRVNSEEFEKAIERCDALVLPSLHEGYPLTLLEACARYRPVISTTVGSNPEVFKDRHCALLVPPRDSRLLAEAMSSIIGEDESAYRARCLDARQLFDKISAPAVVLRKIVEAYDSSSFDSAN
jgi:glycosyltransferase involved in cell wall biosynthesis